MNFWGYRDLDQLRQIRCQYVDELFKQIRVEGYRPNFESEHEVPYAGSTKDNRDEYKHRLEPLVAIGRDGQVYLKDGYHRLAFAHIIGIDRIPVHVLVRHGRWQQVRDEIYHGGDTSGVISANRIDLRHPDLKDITD